MQLRIPGDDGEKLLHRQGGLERDNPGAERQQDSEKEKKTLDKISNPMKPLEKKHGYSNGKIGQEMSN